MDETRCETCLRTLPVQYVRKYGVVVIQNCTGGKNAFHVDIILQLHQSVRLHRSNLNP